MSNRDRGYYIDVRNKVIARKKRISLDACGLDWYRSDGQYSKGKIHCGCGLCKPSKRFRVPSFPDIRLANAMRSQISDYIEG